MKRIIALILSLILCFSFIVSCGKEEEQSSVPTSVPITSSNEETPTQELENDYLPDEKVSYYLKYTSSVDVDIKTKIDVRCDGLKDYDAFLKFKEDMGIEGFKAVTYELFEDHYAMLRVYLSKRNTKTLGYRDIHLDGNNGTLILDALIYYYESYYSNGEYHYYHAPENAIVEESTETTTKTVYYDLIFVPKSKVTTEITENTSIDIKIIEFPLVQK